MARNFKLRVCIAAALLLLLAGLACATLGALGLAAGERGQGWVLAVGLTLMLAGATGMRRPGTAGARLLAGGLSLAGMKVLSDSLGLSRWLEDSAWAGVVALGLLTVGLLTYAGLRDWLAGGRQEPPGATTPPCPNEARAATQSPPLNPSGASYAGNMGPPTRRQS